MTRVSLLSSKTVFFSQIARVITSKSIKHVHLMGRIAIILCLPPSFVLSAISVYGIFSQLLFKQEVLNSLCLNIFSPVLPIFFFLTYELMSSSDFSSLSSIPSLILVQITRMTPQLVCTTPFSSILFHFPDWCSIVSIVPSVLLTTFKLLSNQLHYYDYLTMMLLPLISVFTELALHLLIGFCYYQWR